MKSVEVTVHYLEMLVPLYRSVPAPRQGLTVLHVPSPTVPIYRSLYNAVGKDFHWLNRRKLSDEALAAIIGDTRDELHVLHVDGTPAGFAELDRRQPHEIELVQFGLNINSGEAKLVLLCPAWKTWGIAKTVKPGTVILHSRADDVIPFADSEELVKNSGLRPLALIEVGSDHRLADQEPLEMMLEVCGGSDE
jgi:hypothetical protein